MISRCAILHQKGDNDDSLLLYQITKLLISKLFTSIANHLGFKLKPPYIFSLSPLAIFLRPLVISDFLSCTLHILLKGWSSKVDSPQAESLLVPYNCYVPPVYQLHPDIKYPIELSDLQVFLLLVCFRLKCYSFIKNLNKDNPQTPFSSGLPKFLSDLMLKICLCWQI